MDEKKRAAIERCTKQVQKLMEMAQAIAELPDGLPGKLWASECDLRVDIPHDIPTAVQLRKLLGREWKLTGQFFVADRAWTFRYYEHKTTGRVLIVTMDATQQGTTCRKVQVGEQVVPIFEVICH
jgi:hypothetical protein